MINVTYTPEGATIADGKLEAWANRVVIEHDTHGRVDINVGSESMITILRVFIVRGKIDNKCLTFFHGHNNTPILVNEYGNLSDWPKGFCDAEVNSMVELLEAGRKKRKKKDADIH